MTAQKPGDGRIRAYIQFVAAIFYYFLSLSLAQHASSGLAGEEWSPLVGQAMLVFLLLLGYAGFGFMLNRQAHPVSAQGLPRRSGWTTEAALGIAVGWAMALVCVAAMAVRGGIAVRFSGQLSSWGWLLVDAAFFALLALAEEIAFRGYAFQRFERAIGPVGAALGFAALCAFVQNMQVGSSHSSAAVAFVLSLLLSTAYLRTRALWVSWGINFGWKASRALLFGLTVSGVNSHSPVVQGDPMGSFWLTGGGFGLDGSWVACFVLLATFPFVYRATRDLNFVYNAPEILPAGMAVDLDAAARRQHDAAMGIAEPAAPTLIQIAPVSTVQYPPLPVGTPQGSVAPASESVSSESRTGNDSL
jgi:hypothetical protein